MDKKEYCHKLADISEAIYDTEKQLSNVVAELSCLYHKKQTGLPFDEARIEWFEKAQKSLVEEKQSLEQAHSDLVRDYSWLLDT